MTAPIVISVKSATPSRRCSCGTTDAFGVTTRNAAWACRVGGPCASVALTSHGPSHFPEVVTMVNPTKTALLVAMTVTLMQGLASARPAPHAGEIIVRGANDATRWSVILRAPINTDY